MATERIYYTDAYATEFDAAVVDLKSEGNSHKAELDRTVFYPASGGQLFDTGTLGGVKVIEVVEEDDHVWHHLDCKPPFGVGDRISGKIDWPRRRDNMQKHTGQHLLSRSLIETCKAATISSRLGEEGSTVELDRENVDAADLEKAERLANEIIFEDRPVTVEFIPHGRIKDVPLRKIPERREGTYRVIVIKDFDWSACGGTHCRSTGAVGMVKITGREKIRGHLRLHFLTGLAALEDYRWRHEQVEAIANLFTRHGRESLEGVRALMEENKQLRRQAAELRKELLPAQIEKWYQRAQSISNRKVVALEMPGVDLKEAREAVAALTARYELVVLAAVDDKLLVGVSSGINLSAADIIIRAAQRLGGRGGGSPRLAQGGNFRPEDIKVLIADPGLILEG